MRGSAAFRVSVAPGGGLAPSWVRDSLSRNAGASPSLDLRFADSKSLVDSSTGANLVTFTRASSGTYVGSDGLIKTATTNEARFDHNPTTGESLGLLVEEQRTNLFQYSEEFDNAYWSKTTLNGTLTTNQTAAPDGAITAELYQEDTATSGRYLARSISFTSGTIYTVSCWAKQAPGATRYLGFVLPSASFGVNVTAAFTLSGAGVATIGNSGTNTSASIQAFANGWYRCSLTSQATVTASVAVQFRLSNLSGSAISSYLGDGTSGIYLWGAQLEAGSFPTSYIPTTTATVTRSADVASITGSNFSSWYRQDEGTVFGQYSQYAAGGNVATISDNTAANFIALSTNSAVNKTASANVFVSSANIGRIDTIGTFVAGTTIKAAHGLSNGFRSLSAQGETAVTASNPPTLPVVDRIYIGSNNSGTSTFCNGTIRRLTYWPRRLANETLQQITR